jgi:hypothetical protein
MQSKLKEQNEDELMKNNEKREEYSSEADTEDSEDEFAEYLLKMLQEEKQHPEIQRNNTNGFTQEMLEPIYPGHCSSSLGVMLAFFSFIHLYGKNSPNFGKKLLALLLLCFPKKHTFPDSITKLKKVSMH